MLDKAVYKELFSKAFDITIEVTYWNGKKEKYGERFDRMWSLYLQACAASFESGNIDVIQYLLVNAPSGTGLPMKRNYIYN